MRMACLLILAIVVVGCAASAPGQHKKGFLESLPFVGGWFAPSETSIAITDQQPETIESIAVLGSILCGVAVAAWLYMHFGPIGAAFGGVGTVLATYISTTTFAKFIVDSMEIISKIFWSAFALLLCLVIVRLIKAYKVYRKTGRWPKSNAIIPQIKAIKASLDGKLPLTGVVPNG